MGNWFSPPVGIVYKIKSPNTPQVYIGSTRSMDLERRLRVHEANYRAWKMNKTGWYSVFILLDQGNYEIECLEDIKDPQHIKVRERHHKDKFKGFCVNKRNPYRTLLEKKDQVRKAQKAYYQRNRHKILKSGRQWVHCKVCGSTVMKYSLYRHRRSLKHYQNGYILA